MRFKHWIENTLPSILYHHSPKSNRLSILKYGLQGKYDRTVDLTQDGTVGGVFLTNKSKSEFLSDVWQVDVRGLPIETDWTSTPEEPDEEWYVVYSDISPDRIKLLSY